MNSMNIDLDDEKKQPVDADDGIPMSPLYSSAQVVPVGPVTAASMAKVAVETLFASSKANEEEQPATESPEETAPPETIKDSALSPPTSDDAVEGQPKMPSPQPIQDQFRPADIPGPIHTNHCFPVPSLNTSEQADELFDECELFLAHAGENKPKMIALWLALTSLKLKAFLDRSNLALVAETDEELGYQLWKTRFALLLLDQYFLGKEYPVIEATTLLQRRDKQFAIQALTAAGYPDANARGSQIPHIITAREGEWQKPQKPEKGFTTASAEHITDLIRKLKKLNALSLQGQHDVFHMLDGIARTKPLRKLMEGRLDSVIPLQKLHIVARVSNEVAEELIRKYDIKAIPWQTAVIDTNLAVQREINKSLATYNERFGKSEKFALACSTIFLCLLPAALTAVSAWEYNSKHIGSQTCQATFLLDFICAGLLLFLHISTCAFQSLMGRGQSKIGALMWLFAAIPLASLALAIDCSRQSSSNIMLPYLFVSSSCLFIGFVIEISMRRFRPEELCFELSEAEMNA